MEMSLSKDQIIGDWMDRNARGRCATANARLRAGKCKRNFYQKDETEALRPGTVVHHQI